MIEIEGLKKRFGQSIALDEVSMHVRDGAMYGFVGPNGAGKTTTIRCMMGLLAADGGKLLINGIDMEKEPKKALSQIGYIPDDFGVYDNLKVLEYMEFFASCYGCCLVNWTAHIKSHAGTDYCTNYCLRAAV